MQTKLQTPSGRCSGVPAGLPGLLILLLWSGLPPARAVLVNEASGFGSPSSFGFDDQPAGNTFTAGPQAVGASTGETIVFTSSNENADGGAVISAPASPDDEPEDDESRLYGLADNGTWENPFSWAGVNSESDYIEFRFDSGMVSAAGAFMNYAPGLGTPRIAAYDNQGQLLESYNLETAAPISTPDQSNGGDFRGILRQTLEIRSFRLTGAYAVANTITFSRSVTPEPGPSQSVPGPLPLLGLAGAWGWARRLRRQIRRPQR
jgi:MYXO-CTERM domain-containing protein